MKRYEGNPIITPADVKPSREDFEVVCVFNCGVTKFEDETLLLMRVAEVPKNDNPDVFLAPMLDAQTNELIIKSYDKTDKSIDFSDSRFVITPDDRVLTSISHFRIARSKDGFNFVDMAHVNMLGEVYNQTTLSNKDYFNIYDDYGVEE